MVQVNIKDYQSLVTGSDWKPAFDAALAAADEVYVPGGIYSTSMVDVPGGKTIYGDGDSTTFKGLSSVIFRVIGSIGTEVNVTADVADFTNSITVASTSDLAANDFILLKGQRDCLNEIDSGEAWTLGYATPGAQGLYFGEYMEVESISGNVITTKATTVYPFYKNNNLSETSPSARATSTVQKVNFIKDVTLRDFKIEKTTGNAIELRYAYNCVVDNVKMDAKGYADGQFHFVIMYYCLNCEARYCDFKIPHKITPSQIYYVNIYKCISSINSGFFKCTSYGASQSIDFTYGALQFPGMGCYVDSCTIENATTTGITSHGGTFQSKYVNNTVRGCKQGMSIRSRNSIISHNTLTGSMNPSSSSSFAIGLYEGYALDCVISNNTIVNFTTGIGIFDGPDLGESFKYCGAIISNNTIKNYIRGISISKSVQKVFVDMGIRISNNVFYGQNDTTAIGVYMGAYSKGVTIKDNTFYGRAVWSDWNSSNIKVIGNTMRGGTTSVFIRGMNDSVITGGMVFVELYANEFLNVATQYALGAYVKRIESIQHKYLNFNEVAASADVFDTNSLFIDKTDNKLKFKDNDGVIKVITLS